MACHVIIPAAGSGSRMENSIPKQYLLLNASPLIAHVVRTFCNSSLITSVHVVLSEGDPYWANIAQHIHPSTKLKTHFCGGETRAQTVLNGLTEIKNSVAADDWILVHDAARPGLTEPLLEKLIHTLQADAVGGLLALPLADTLKRANTAQQVAQTIPRADLWQAQTPQMFRYDMLVNALSNFNGVPTDEAEAIEALGFKPTLVTGLLRNLKVTYPQDLTVLTALMQTKN